MLTRRFRCLHCGQEFERPRTGGRPPATCSPTCRTAYRTAQRRDQRDTVAAETESPRVALDNALDAHNRLAEEVGRIERQAAAMLASGAILSADDLDGEAVPATWDEQAVESIDRDPALAWLAANAPEALADFPRAAIVGKSSPSVRSWR